jgi:hypothetical protein
MLQTARSVSNASFANATFTTRAFATFSDSACAFSTVGMPRRQL